MTGRDRIEKHGRVDGTTTHNGETALQDRSRIFGPLMRDNGHPKFDSSQRHGTLTDHADG